MVHTSSPSATQTRNMSGSLCNQSRSEHQTSTNLVLFVDFLEPVKRIRQSVLVDQSAGRHFRDVHVRVSDAVGVGNLLTVGHDSVIGGRVEKRRVLVLDNLGKLEQQMRRNTIEVPTGGRPL